MLTARLTARRHTPRAALAASLLTVALAASACGSGDSGSGSGSTGAQASSGTTAKAAPTAACKLDTPPTSAAKAPTGAAPTAKASGKVGVILPDTTSSTRYTLYDKPLLQKALSDAGLTPDIQNAGGSTARFQQIAAAMIGDGVKVLIIDSIDATSGAAVEKQAAAAGIKVIDYDRVNLGGTADYYVSFDNEDVGRLQAQTLVACLDQSGVQNAQLLVMSGGKDVDNNAVLFEKGALDVLKPLEGQGKVKIASVSTVKGWDVNVAAPTFTQALQAAGGKVDGVLAANDDVANASIGVLKGSGLAGRVPVTGQDAGVSGLQNIIKGQQSMTIFKDVKLEAQAAAQLAIALVSGTDPAAAGLTLTDFQDPKAPAHKIKALLLPAQVITQANIMDVVKAGALKTTEICKGIEADCQKLGIA